MEGFRTVHQSLAWSILKNALGFFAVPVVKLQGFLRRIVFWSLQEKTLYKLALQTRFTNYRAVDSKMNRETVDYVNNPGKIVPHRCSEPSYPFLAVLNGSYANNLTGSWLFNWC